MSTQSTTRCEYCGSATDSVSTRRGRGAQALCDTCDAWIAERMRETTVVVPDTVTVAAGGEDAALASGRTLALDPGLPVADALEYAIALSYEAIGQLEAAGYETVEDLWLADREELLSVPNVAGSDVDAIVETISTEPTSGFAETLERLQPDDVDELGTNDNGDGSDDDDPSDDDAEIL